MPQMKILVRFMPSVIDFAIKGRTQAELAYQKEKKKTPVFFLVWSCPTCGKAFQYDGKQRMDCPDCKKREEDLAGISGIGAPLARRGT